MLICVFTCVRVCESEARFGFSQLVKVMQAHYIGCLKMALRVFVAFPASSYLIVKLGGGQGSQEGGVGTRDTYSIVWE